MPSPPPPFAAIVDHPNPIPEFDFTSSYDPDVVQSRGWGIGGYNERRVQSMYNNAELYDEARCIHVGVDIWGPVGTAVHAFSDATIYAVEHHDTPKNYGPTVITEQMVNGKPLWALHGHLSMETLNHVRPGQNVEKGAVIGWFGDVHENGNWPPHLHVQLSRVEPTEGDMPGVVAPSNRSDALKTYPDPRIVLGDIF